MSNESNFWASLGTLRSTTNGLWERVRHYSRNEGASMIVAKLGCIVQLGRARVQFERAHDQCRALHRQLELSVDKTGGQPFRYAVSRRSGDPIEISRDLAQSGTEAPVVQCFNDWSAAASSLNEILGELRDLTAQVHALDLPEWNRRTALYAERDARAVILAWESGRLRDTLPGQELCFGWSELSDMRDPLGVIKWVARILRHAIAGGIRQRKGRAVSITGGRRVLSGWSPYGLRMPRLGHIPAQYPLGRLSDARNRIAESVPAGSVDPYPVFVASHLDTATQIRAHLFGLQYGHRRGAQLLRKLGMTRASLPTIPASTPRLVGRGIAVCAAYWLEREGARRQPTGRISGGEFKIRYGQILVIKGWCDCYHLSDTEEGFTDLQLQRLAKKIATGTSGNQRADVARILRAFRAAPRVSFQDSRNAGNCEVGTRGWIRSLGLDSLLVGSY